MPSNKNSPLLALIYLVLFSGLSFFYSPSVQARPLECTNLFVPKKIKLPSGARFEYLSILSYSGESIIYLLNETQILRFFKTPDPNQSTSRFIDGYDDLRAHGVVSLVAIINSGPDWVIQERVDVRMTLETFLFKAVELQAQSPETFQTMVRELHNFGLQTSAFDDLGDFHSGQLAWNGSQWILLDWNHENDLAGPNGNGTFEQGLETPSPLARMILQDLHLRIIERRRSLRNRG